eukprot:CAMPEP_0119488396 /NCGR_PEP_ID=MMETSP1344-20130328/14196_1 /TAXON_ID=236787 /ORGANISM="Florenciella parvula, Strain CCMP2471" /LENGTH=305 /DNA_ID=CAMNT_0007523351 /DNA_START=166 /DNA_END=1080 /DNA_ORIENTATION=+
MLLHELRCAGGKSPTVDRTEATRPTKRARTGSSAPRQSQSQPQPQPQSTSSFALLVEMIIHQKNAEYRDRFGGRCLELTTRANEACPHGVHEIIAIARGGRTGTGAGAIAHVLNAGGEAGTEGAWLSKASCLLRLAEAVADGSLVLPTFETRPYSRCGDGSDSRFKGVLTGLNVTCLANPGRAKLFWIRLGRTDVIAAETDEVRAAMALLFGHTSSVMYAIRAKETLCSPKDTRDWFRVNFEDELHSEVSALLLRLYKTHNQDAIREHDVATAVTKSALEALAKPGRRDGGDLWGINCTPAPRAW